MTELVAALLPVHGSLSFLVDVDRLLDSSGGSLWLPVDHRCVVSPVYHDVFIFLMKTYWWKSKRQGTEKVFGRMNLTVKVLLTK